MTKNAKKYKKYFSSCGEQLDVQMEQETVWLTQDQMAALFGRDKSVISRHIKRIFETEDQEKDWVKVLYEVILKILTLGFYHVEKHRKDK